MNDFLISLHLLSLNLANVAIPPTTSSLVSTPTPSSNNNNNSSPNVRGSYHKPKKDEALQKIRELMIANYSKDQIISTLSGQYPARTLYTYYDLAWDSHVESMLDAKTINLRIVQGAVLLSEQYKSLARKMESIVDDNSAPHKNRVDAAELLAKLMLSIFKIYHYTSSQMADNQRIVNEISIALETRFEKIAGTFDYGSSGNGDGGNGGNTNRNVS
jgi:hypothetical protein